MKKVTLNLNERSYNILIGKGALSCLPNELKRLDIGRDAFVVTNPRLKGLYGKKLKGLLRSIGYSVKCQIIPDSERAKSASVCIKILNKIAEYDTKKRIFIIAFGGGVVGDLAGFIASIYRRGIPYVQIPTTLLSQVDSAIGGKVAIDLPVGKNLAGSFYQPRLVVSDVSLLKSLPSFEVKNGLAEIVKYGIIKDEEFFAKLEEKHKDIFDLKTDFMDYVMHRCSKIKAEVVQRDERDKKDIRIILNYGHTIGHAIEAAGGYKNYTHGEAVAIGMLAEAELAYNLGFLKKRSLLRIENLLKAIGLPTFTRGVQLSRVLKAQEHDKKIISGVNRFVLPTRIGRVKVCENVAVSRIASALRQRIR